MASKKVPLRMCVVCQNSKEKSQLIRISTTKEGQVSLDLNMRNTGRGFYICRNKECITRAQRRKKFDKIFRGKLSIDLIAEIHRELEGDDGSKNLRNAQFIDQGR